MLYCTISTDPDMALDDSVLPANCLLFLTKSLYFINLLMII